MAYRGIKNYHGEKNLCNILFLIGKLSQKLKGKLSKVAVS